MEDEWLLARFVGGEEGALEEIIRRHETKLYAYLARLTGDRHIAEDIFQETFLRVATGAERFEPGRPFKPWLYSIATRLAIDVLRKKAVRQEVSLEDALGDGRGGGGAMEPAGDRTPDPGEEAKRREENERLLAAILRLTELERAVVLMHFREGMTLGEVAAALSIPIGTVKSRLHAGLRRLAADIGRRGGGRRE
ncbi:MAG: RNA polymerase sigma factor [Planctomycetota bacterium]|nr:RNA polymerase sigma factor [Planctomycetota bacterium]